MLRAGAAAMTSPAARQPVCPSALTSAPAGTTPLSMASLIALSGNGPRGGSFPTRRKYPATLLAPGDLDPERRPLLRLGEDDRPVVRGGDALREREAEAGPAGPPGDERIEDARRDVRGHARPVVLDLDDDLAVRGPGARRDRRR